jgi:RimJ/RimL family protein N-acetyltransferase
VTRAFITFVFAYPFLQLGLPRVNCVISERNTDSLRFTRHFGWSEEGRVREAGDDGEDLIFFGMLRRECRYLPPFAALAMPAASGYKAA